MMNRRAFNSARRTRWLICLLSGFSCLVLAEKSAEPSDDFLAYLGDMEDSDDNWSDFSDENRSKTDVHVHQASSTSSTSVQSHGSEGSASGRSRT